MLRYRLAGGTMPFAERAPCAVYLGSITPLRCIEEIVRAMESPLIAPQARLLLAGTFEEGGIEERVRSMH